MSNMVVNTNVLALNAHRSMKKVGAAQFRASSRLSSGLRINTAADDAAGLAISEKMRSQIRGLDQASRNAQDGISMVQTAEGGMTEITNMVQRIRELVVQAANDSNDFDSNDRTKIQGEILQLIEEIDAMADRVEFNKKQLINGDYATTSLHLQVGPNAGHSILFNIESVKTTTLKGDNDGTVMSLREALTGLDDADPFVIDSTTKGDPSALVPIEVGVNRLDGEAISALLDVLDGALSMVTDERAKLGAIQNRLEYTISSLDISSENLSASESRIRDADMAKEMMAFTKTNVLQQAAVSMLAQANQAPQAVLQLLG